MLDEKIEKQYKILNEFLSREIDSDYIYIDVPIHPNVGDWLIALGAWELLKRIPYKCIDKVDWGHLDTSKINDNTIILFHGGGNFGDLWRSAVEGRNEIIEKFPKNKVIILPQTITYIDNSLLQKDAEFYGKYKNVSICARDSVSYELAKNYFSNNQIYLLPDTAIGLYHILPKANGINNGRTLVINRDDKEVDAIFAECEEAKDWGEILDEIRYENVLLVFRIVKKVRKTLPWQMFYNFEIWYVVNVMYKFMLKRVPNYFLRYRDVKTTRLHGYLLASMLHMPTEILDTKYNKIRNYIKTWMK